MNMASRTFIVGLILAAASWNLRADEDKKEPRDDLVKKNNLKEEQYDFGYLHRYWGLKLKDISTRPLRKDKVGSQVKEFEDFQMLFEFERTLTFNEVSELREALQPPVKKVHFVLQDQDNIVFGECKQFKVEGQISGFKGDAIRVTTQDIETHMTARARKLIARQFEP